MADDRIVWVHGIGPYGPGYSLDWTNVFNSYLHLSAASFVEVLWDTALVQPTPSSGGLLPESPWFPLNALEQVAAAAIKDNLNVLLAARAAALAHLPPPGPIGQIPAFFTTPLAELPPGFFGDQYVGEFTKYLASRGVRSAVKAKFKQQVQPLAATGAQISVIAHSWGTVVAYESLLDLQVEQPSLKVANLITLGSPLWLVRPLLDYHSGEKPADGARWLNIFAEGDVVGAYLHPSFQVDDDEEAPNFGGTGDPHDSYFLAGNAAVQQALVAKAILGGA
jgi:hypothetical protein